MLKIKRIFKKYWNWGAFVIFLFIPFLVSKYDLSFQTKGIVYLVLGTFWLFLISFVEEYFDNYKFFKALYIGIAVALGGLMLTWGWDSLGNADKKEELIVSAIREWNYNDIMSEGSSFDSNDPNILKWDFVYPNFHNQAVYSLLSSTLLDLNRQDDYRFYGVVLMYFNATDTLQARLNILNEILVGRGGQALKVRRSINKSKLVREFLEAHAEFGELIKKEYESALKKALKTSIDKVEPDNIK